MTLNVQFKLKENPYYVRYLREHSYYYKILTRDPSKIDEMIELAKTEYKLRKTDRLAKTLEYIDLFQNIINSLK